MSQPEAKLAAVDNNGTEPTDDKLKIAELEKQVEKLNKLYQGACLEARLAQLRAEHAEKQLDDKRRVREDIEKAIEKGKVEELEKKNTDLLRENGKLTSELETVKSNQDCLRKENEHLRSRLKEGENAEMADIADVPDDESTIPTFTLPIQNEKKEEPMEPQAAIDDTQNSTHDSMGEGEAIEDEGALNNDVNTGMGNVCVGVEDLASDPLFNNDESTHGTIHHSDLMEDGLNFDEDMVEDRDLAMADKDSNKIVEEVNGTGLSEMDVNERANSVADIPTEGEEETEEITDIVMSSEVKKGRRSSRVAVKPLQYKETDEDSAEDDEPTRKKSKSESEKKKVNMGKSSTNGSSLSDSATKGQKMNYTELKCPECEHHTRSVRGWEKHLKHAHSTNAKQAGVALRCACGVDCYGESHFRTCKIAQATIIKMEYKRENPGNMNDTDLECNECEYRSKSVRGWICHLNRIHSTTPTLAGLVLRCDCGHESFSESHILGCKSTNVVVIRKRDGPIQRIRDEKEKPGNMNDTDLECNECEYRSKSVRGWICHLNRIHSTTPTLAGLVLRCDCGHESFSESHILGCKSTNVVVIRKRDGPIRRIQDEKETPQCVLCEAHPTTILGYPFHLQCHHNTTLKERGIYLKCACGINVTTRNSLHNHKECLGRNFTLHQLDEDDG